MRYFRRRLRPYQAKCSPRTGVVGDWSEYVRSLQDSSPPCITMASVCPEMCYGGPLVGGVGSYSVNGERSISPSSSPWRLGNPRFGKHLSRVDTGQISPLYLIMTCKL
jgi:hypothetical protein